METRMQYLDYVCYGIYECLFQDPDEHQEIILLKSVYKHKQSKHYSKQKLKMGCISKHD